jgi:hypothetical protein
VVETADLGRRLRLRLNGRELEGSLALQGHQLLCGRERFALERDWRQEPDLAPSLWGDYLVKGHPGLRRLRLSGEGLWLNGVASAGQAQHGQVVWSEGPAGAERGQVMLLLDPISLHPVLHGQVNGQPVVGLVPVPEGTGRQPPQFGLSPGAWRTLQTLQAQRAWLLGGLIWHKWERASLYAQIIDRSLAKRLP